MRSTTVPADKGALAMRLERNQKELRQLKSTLNCYLYEPRTYSLFERYEALRTRLEVLSKSHSEIIQVIKTPRKSLANCLDMAMEQMNEFAQLQKGVEEYVAGARNS